MKFLFTNIWVFLNEMKTTTAAVILAFLFGTIFSDALRLTNVTIPMHIDLSESAVMSCNFDLGGGKLYSVKWYKDESEFFRYMPDNNPQIQSFPLTGISLDLSRSNMTVITLQPLNFNTSGSYKCEVSTDGPSFETVVRNGNMSVIIYPKEEPSINGIEKYYTPGDFITGNCTSSPSNPPAELTWYINNVQAGNWLLYKYPMKNDGLLFSTAVGLRFKVEQQHFIYKDNLEQKLEIKCRAKIGDFLQWERVAVVKSHSARSYNFKPATDRYRNNGVIGKMFDTELITWVLIIQFWLLKNFVL